MIIYFAIPLFIIFLYTNIKFIEKETRYNMSTYIYKYVATLSVLTILGSTISEKPVEASLKSDQKAHPEATFHIQQNGSYTYYYEETPSTFPANRKPSYPNPPARINHPNSNGSYYQNPSVSAAPITLTTEQPPSQNGPSVPPPTLVPEVSVSNETESPQTKAFKRDKHGFITSINTDVLYDELQILHFNDDALTAEGKPLAIGNGKIIDQPIYTSKNNLYTAGQCTWYVFSKRAQVGKTISTFWGDARNWAAKATSEGFKVNKTPKAGAIMQNYEGPYGHVAYVERVNLDGSILISEMNYIAPYITSTRTIPASAVHLHNYIH